MLDDTDQSPLAYEAAALPAGSGRATADTGPAAGVGPNAGGMALTAAGAATSMYGTYLSSRYNRNALRQSAQLARMQAQQAREAGAFAAARVSTREGLIEAQERGSAAGGNVLVNSGSNKAVQYSTEQGSNMDRYMIETNARRQAFGYQMRGVGLDSEARMQTQNATMAMAGTAVNAGSQLWLESDPNFAGFRGRGIQFAP